MAEQSSPERANLLLPAVFGLIFGFLLQRGGMGKYEVLMGQLLLTNWAVLKVMVTAILVAPTDCVLRAPSRPPPLMPDQPGMP